MPQRIGLHFAIPTPQFVQAYFVVGVSIEFQRQIQIAHRNVPSAGDSTVCDGETQVTGAALMREDIERSK